MSLDLLHGERDDIYDSVALYMAAGLDQWEAEALASLPADPAAYQDQANIIAILLAAGLDDLFQNLPYNDIVAVGRDIAESAGAGNTSALNASKLPAIRERNRQFLQSRVGVIAAKLQARVAETALLGPPSVADMQQTVEQVLKDAIPGLKTDAETALAVWDRQVQLEIGDAAGLGLYVYMGPFDRLNRPFCRSVLGANQVYTRDQVEELNNHPDLHDYVPPNVFVLCGGYNCRHMWVPVSKKFAADNGYAGAPALQ